MSDAGLCGCVPGHRMTVAASYCEVCGLTEQQVCEDPTAALRPCVPKQRCGCPPETFAAVLAGGTCGMGGCPHGGDF